MLNAKTLKSGLMNGTMIGVGVVAQQLVKKNIPIKDQLIKNGATAVLGVILASQKSVALVNIGLGMVGGSALGVAQTLSPNLLSGIGMAERQYQISCPPKVSGSLSSNLAGENANLIGAADKITYGITL